MYPSPGVDYGYDISDYTAIDPLYGTMADFDNLVAEAKKRNIRVIMDYVINHTSDQHKWFLESRSSRDNPKRDWYIWRDGKGKQPPTKASRRTTGSRGSATRPGSGTRRRASITTTTSMCSSRISTGAIPRSTPRWMACSTSG